MYRTILIVLAAGVILTGGFLHGRLTNRWRDSHEMDEAVARLKNFKNEIGDWIGKDANMNPKHLQVAEIQGYVARQYVHRTTGERVTVLLICGRPGPISVHTPDVCYQGAGYKMGPKEVQPISSIPGTRAPSFWAARFTKEPEPAPLHIIWAWSTGGLWTAPDNPRLAFYQSPVLYKLYLVREGKGTEAPVIDEVTHSFMKDFYPVLQQAIAGTSTPPAS